MATRYQAQRALDLHEERLSKCGRIVGLGIVPAGSVPGKTRRREYAVAVYVKGLQPEARDLPATLKVRMRSGEVEVPIREIEQGEVKLEKPPRREEKFSFE